MNKKKIFITGATSKIGKYLINNLDFSRYDTYVLSRDKDPDLVPPVKIILGDLLDPRSYSSVFENHIGTIVHLGAITHTNHIDRYYKTNAEATGELIKLCESNKISRFIFISTRAI